MTIDNPRPVLVGVDGTPGSEGAIRYAVHEAIGRGTSLQVVHVAPSSPPTSETDPSSIAAFRAVGRTILETTESSIRGLAPDLDVGTTLCQGSRVVGVAEAAHDAQLVVVGRETRRGLDRVLSGTIIAGVASHAGCPVVAVPSFWSGSSAHGRVVVGVKSRERDWDLASQAFESAESRGASLTLLTSWVLPDPYLDRVELRRHSEEWAKDGLAVLEGIVTDLRPVHPDLPVDLRVVHGRAASALLDAASEADLLILGRHRHAPSPHGRLSGTVHAILRAAEIPVEVVPTE